MVMDINSVYVLVNLISGFSTALGSVVLDNMAQLPGVAVRDTRIRITSSTNPLNAEEIEYRNYYGYDNAMPDDLFRAVRPGLAVLGSDHVEGLRYAALEAAQTTNIVTGDKTADLPNVFARMKEMHEGAVPYYHVIYADLELFTGAAAVSHQVSVNYYGQHPEPAQHAVLAEVKND
jgi:hypothetical protein